MAGQFCFCGDVRRGVDAGVGVDGGGGLLGCVGGVFFVVDGDAGEQGAVEDAAPTRLERRLRVGKLSRTR